MAVHKKRYAMVVDLRRCIGCQTCQVVCKNENEVPLGVWRSWVKQVEKGETPFVRKSFVPSLCNNCNEPICVTVCPVKASYQREDGIVMIDPHLCIGCRYCMAACPYDVRFVHPVKKVVDKCYWCVHRLDRGLLPACVEACPAGALIFGDMNDHTSEVFQLTRINPVQRLKPEMATFPQTYYIGLDNEAADARGGAEWKASE